MRFEDPLSFISRVLTKLFSLWVSGTYPFASKGSNLSMHYTTLVSRRVAPVVKLGNSVTFCKDAWLNTFYIWDRDGEPKIIIDDNCLIGSRSVISAKNLIHIECDVVLGASVLIQDHNHAYEDISLPIRVQRLTPGGTIRIERGCRIGQGVAIVCAQGELVLGQHSIVAPNSVVLRSVAPYSSVGGNPARVIERLDVPQANIESQARSTEGVVSQERSMGYVPEASRAMPNHGGSE